MADLDGRPELVAKLADALPGGAIFVRATLQGAFPMPLQPLAESTKGRITGGDGVIVEPSVQHHPEPLPGLHRIIVHAHTQLLFDRLQGASYSLGDGLASQFEAAAAGS